MNMIWQQMTLHDSTFFLAGQLMKQWPQKFSDFSKHRFAAILRYKLQNHTYFGTLFTPNFGLLAAFGDPQNGFGQFALS
jgi:hypothetical protein